MINCVFDSNSQIFDTYMKKYCIFLTSIPQIFDKYQIKKKY